MIIGLLGVMGSGKDTVANILVESYGYSKISCADSLKDVCSAVFSWERMLLEGDTLSSRVWRDTVDEWWAERLNISDFTPRKAMQLIGTDLFREHFNKDIWVNTLRRKISHQKNIVVSDVRFLNEIKAIRQENGILVEVRGRKNYDWYNVAYRANTGCLKSKNELETWYSNVHRSEWEWISTKVDYDIHNNKDFNNLKIEIEKIFK